MSSAQLPSGQVTLGKSHCDTEPLFPDVKFQEFQALLVETSSLQKVVGGQCVLWMLVVAVALDQPLQEAFLVSLSLTGMKEPKVNFPSCGSQLKSTSGLK